MKNLFVLFIALFFFSSQQAIAQCSNQLRNPNASQGLQGWNKTGVADAAGGVFRLLKPKASLVQTVRIPRGSRTVYLSGWSKATSKQTGFPMIYGEIISQNGSVLRTINLGVNTSLSWKQYADGASIPRGAVAVKYYMARRDAGKADARAIALFDNLCLSFDCKCKTPMPKEEKPTNQLKDCCSGQSNPSDFEDLPLSPAGNYSVGSSFQSEGRRFFVKPYYDSNNQITSAGVARVINPSSGFSGKAVIAGNTNLQFGLKRSVSCIRFKAANMGGNMNIMINGQRKNFGRASDINGEVIGGVRISAGGGPNQAGMWFFEGNIRSFSVGGQELIIDQVCF